MSGGESDGVIKGGVFPVFKIISGAEFSLDSEVASVFLFFGEPVKGVSFTVGNEGGDLHSLFLGVFDNLFEHLDNPSSIEFDNREGSVSLTTQLLA